MFEAVLPFLALVAAPMKGDKQMKISSGAATDHCIVASTGVGKLELYHNKIIIYAICLH